MLKYANARANQNGSAKVKRIHLERPVEGLDMLNGRLCDRRSQYQMHMERLAVTDLTAFKILAPVSRKILCDTQSCNVEREPERAAMGILDVGRKLRDAAYWCASLQEF